MGKLQQSHLEVTLKTVCMWWFVGNTCVRLSEDPPRSGLNSTACSVRSVGDTVQAEPHCLLQLKHISDQTAAPTLLHLPPLLGLLLNPFQFYPLDFILLQVPTKYLLW